MVFMDDLAAGLSWLDPAPIGTVEPGWIDLVPDMPLNMAAAVATCPGIPVDLLQTTERDVASLVGAVVVETNAATRARTLTGSTRSRCGRPGRLRQDRMGRPAMRCDDRAEP